jgi:hypothetical protein
MPAHHAKPLSSVLVGTLALRHLPLMLAVAALLFVALPADAGDTPCTAVPVEILRGDKLRLLRVWACGYSNDSGVAERGRIVMVTYRRTPDGWLAVTSQSITLEEATLWDTKDETGIGFGQTWGHDTCRIGSPAGSIGCSVPNTHKVTFYSRSWNVPPGHQMFTAPIWVSWRDDQGYPHRFIDVSDPEGNPVYSPTWTSK